MGRAEAQLGREEIIGRRGSRPSCLEATNKSETSTRHIGLLKLRKGLKKSIDLHVCTDVRERVCLCLRVCVHARMHTIQLSLRVFHNSFPVDCGVPSCMHGCRRPPDGVESTVMGKQRYSNGISIGI